jgi:serine/threonine protein kinase
MLRFQSELGVVEEGMNTPWGRLERQIGAGGFGKVWLIADGDRKLAYKLYHANELSDKEKVRRFRNGYDAMRMLHHPSIVNVYDYGTCPPGFIMDYIEGQNLRELAPGNYMEPAEILAILLTAAEAIEHAHNNDVIHRDIKPENIVCSLNKDGKYVPSLTDFDLAWFSTQTQRATKTAMGVIYYAAPEQYFSFNPKAVRSKTPALDVYSFGQLLYFCLTNNDPDPVNISNNSENLNRTLFQSCSAEGAKDIIELYENCVRFKPEERIQSFGEVIIALGRIIQGLSHTERDGRISFEQYIGEVAYQMTGHVPQSGSTSFTTSAGTWAISAQQKEVSQK